MSLIPKPAFLRAAGMAKAGPTPIISGGTPATEKLTTLPYTFNPNFLATSLLASKTTEAPSVT